MDRRFDDLRQLNRRAFLQGGFATLATFLCAGMLPGCGAGSGGAGVRTSTAVGTSRSNIRNVGPLGDPDSNGIRLPTGFSSRVIARSGLAPVASSSTLWHPAPDGGACFAMPDGGWIYVSNCEMQSGTGGARALRFNASAAIVDCYVILSGTSNNCAGGKMPWGAWLSCEENGDLGHVHECDPTGATPAIVRPALGRFSHEAVAWDAVQSRLYLTEDRNDGRLYRFTPFALLASGAPDLSAGALEVAAVNTGAEGKVTWLPVPDPSGTSAPARYQITASTPFNRGEGMCARAGIVYFATTGDSRIWAYDVASQNLVILYDESTSPTPILSGIDNIDLSADGDVLAAEDGGDMQLVAITPQGTILPILQVMNQTRSEIAGPAFDPSGTRLYFSSQRGQAGTSSGGITYEVTGPFVVST